MKTKPLILRIEDANREIVSIINNIMRKYDLPCYFLKPIIESVHNQINAESNQEIETLTLKYAEDSEKTEVSPEKSEEDKV